MERKVITVTVLSKKILFRMIKRLLNKLSIGKVSPTDKPSLIPFVMSEVELFGVHMRLITHKNDNVIGAWVRGTTSWSSQDLAEYKLLLSHASGSKIIVDVGANIGIVSILLSHAAPAAQIYACEPDPLNFSMAQLNLELNGCHNVHLAHAAVADFTGTIRLHRSHDNWGDHRTYEALPGRQIRSSSLEETTYSVPAIEPKGVLNVESKIQTPISVDLLKIDTQGSDIKILQTFRPFLREGSIVSVEFSPEHLQMSGTKAQDVCDCLRAARRIQMVIPAPLLDSGWTTKDTDLNELVNYFNDGVKGYPLVGYRDIIIEW